MSSMKVIFHSNNQFLADSEDDNDEKLILSAVLGCRLSRMTRGYYIPSLSSQTIMSESLWEATNKNEI